MKRGVDFEHVVVESLKRLRGLDIVREGGPGDAGVDFGGWWRLSSSVVVGVVGQCKCLSRPIGPSVVREMEGSLSSYVSHSTSPLLGLIVSSAGFSRSCQWSASRSVMPLFLIHTDATTGHWINAIPNDRMSKLLPQMTVATALDKDNRRHPVLLWNGEEMISKKQ